MIESRISRIALVKPPDVADPRLIGFGQPRSGRLLVDSLQGGGAPSPPFRRTVQANVKGPGVVGQHHGGRPAQDDGTLTGEELSDAGLDPLPNIGPEHKRIPWQREVEASVEGG
jgi:hypothetical protein